MIKYRPGCNCWYCKRKRKEEQARWLYYQEEVAIPRLEKEMFKALKEGSP
jgi:hypothetical protein